MSRQPGNYHIAARRRQIILDFLMASPGATMSEIAAHVAAAGDGRSVSNTVRTLADWSEIRHEGPARSRRYFALLAQTRSAEECKRIREANLAQSNAAKKIDAHPEPKPGETWRYIHRPGKHPIKNTDGRGQGALRPRVYVNCGGSHV